MGDYMFRQPFTQRKQRLLGLALLFIVLLSLSSGMLPAQAATSPSACAVTPNLLGGQGFSVSGQGFSVSGQGFSVSGQGFSVSGQGFSVSGQGFSVSGQAVNLDPLTVAHEIIDNPITPGQWQTDRLDYFLNKLGFNTYATAIIIVDEFTGGTEPHGVIVKKVVDDSIAALKVRVPDLKIDSFAVDISDANTQYNADAIANKISSKVTELKSSYRNFVLNMSFGLISCTDPGPVVGGTPLPAFNFNQATQVIAANNQSAPTLALTPVLECVAKVSYGDDDHWGKSRVSDHRTGDYYSSYIAYFGYKNENDQLVKIPVGDSNKFSPIPQNSGQPTQFEPSRQKFVFGVKFNGSTITWSVKGPDGQTRTVSASKYSTPCATPPPAPTQTITPAVECVANLGSGNYEAHFSYNNPNAVGSNIPVGTKNSFTPTPADRGQLTTFAPGSHRDVFKVSFTGGTLSWKLGSLTVTADPNTTKACPEQQGFGMSQYFTQNLGVPADKVAAYWNQIASPVSTDEFQSLRVLLDTYLSDSADPSKNYTVVTVASSGNLKPWLENITLAPGSWKETIAVGATLDNKADLWSFSQNANVVAPGAGYPTGSNSFAAGTSFAAPAFSVLVGMCSTVPGALKFDGKNPPLVLDTAGNKVFSNSFIATSDFTPFVCKPNSNPTISALSDRSDKEGATVSFQASASDPDSNPLTFSATGLPSGVNISSSGLISGTLAAGSAGTYNVTVTVKDNAAAQGSASTSFKWTVTADVVTVKIDIRPYSWSNRINLKSPGFVATAIFGSSTFDATSIDPKTVTLAGAPAVKLFGKFYTLTFDLNRDGKLDRILWFQPKNMQLTPTSTEAVLLGKTVFGIAFRGVDKVKIVPWYAPHLSSPANGGIVNDKQVKLSWTDDQDSEVGDNICYVVQVSKSAGFSTVLQGAIVVDQQSMTTNSLSNGTYFWRAAFSDCSSTTLSSWSDVGSFKVQR
jgi:hypothetical protein